MVVYVGFLTNKFVQVMSLYVLCNILNIVDKIDVNSQVLETVYSEHQILDCMVISGRIINDVHYGCVIIVK